MADNNLNKDNENSSSNQNNIPNENNLEIVNSSNLPKPPDEKIEEVAKENSQEIVTDNSEFFGVKEKSQEKPNDIESPGMTTEDIISALDLPDSPESVQQKVLDMNISGFDDILKILVNNDLDYATVEPGDDDVKIVFRKNNIIKDTKYVKYPVYSNILLKAKSVAKLKLDATEEEQKSTQEIKTDGKDVRIFTRTVPSNFGERLFIRTQLIDKKLEKKQGKKITPGQIFTFIFVTGLVGAILGGSFLGFIVLNAQTVEDVRFFSGLGISLNEINAFIGYLVNAIFIILLSVLSIFLIIFLFRFFLTKAKTFKRKKIMYGVLSVILLAVTLGTLTGWMKLTEKIDSLPNWQEMSYGEIQIYDNDKLTNNNFDKAGALITDTSKLIGPITIRFDLSYLAQNEERKGMKVNNLKWDFGNLGVEETPETEAILIKTFSTVGMIKPIVTIIGELQGKPIEKIVEIPIINIGYIVDMEERTLSSGGKMITFDASSLQELGNIEWYDIDDLNTPLYTGARYISSKPIFEDTLFVMKVKDVDYEIVKLFVIRGENELGINGKIEYTRSTLNDLEVTFKVVDVTNTAGAGYIEKFVWKFGTATQTKEGSSDDPEASSETSYTFGTYGEQTVSVQLINSAGESKTLETKIDLSKVMKVSEGMKICADGTELTNVIYNSSLNEYIINDLGIPNEMKFDASKVKLESSPLYDLTGVKWDVDSDGDIDSEESFVIYPINAEGKYVVTAYFTFTSKKASSNIVEITQKVVIEAVKKEVVVDFEIKKIGEYAPITVGFDASRSQIKDSNIVKFIWDYGDGISEDTDAVIPGHKYTEAGEYQIKLTIVAENGKSYSTTKALILKPEPQSAHIGVSIKNPPVGQGVNFNSSGSKGVISSFLWDFGDGNISTDAHPTHSFSKAGKYNVTLTLEFTNRNVLTTNIDIEVR